MCTESNPDISKWLEELDSKIRSIRFAADYLCGNDGAKAMNLKKEKWVKEADLIKIDTAAKLRYVVDQIKTREKVGVAFFGSFGESFSDYAEQVVFCYASNVIVIDVSKVKNVIWPMLKDDIFQNTSLLKIGHDLTPIQLYLYHYQMIHLRNVFDTQLMDLYVRYKMDPASFDKPKVRKVKPKWTLRPLFPYMFERYLSVDGKALPKAEREFLGEMQMRDKKRIQSDFHVVMALIFLEDLKVALEKLIYQDYYSLMSSKEAITKTLYASPDELSKALTTKDVDPSMIKKYFSQGKTFDC